MRERARLAREEESGGRTLKRAPTAHLSWFFPARCRMSGQMVSGELPGVAGLEPRSKAFPCVTALVHEGKNMHLAGLEREGYFALNCAGEGTAESAS